MSILDVRRVVYYNGNYTGTYIVGKGYTTIYDFDRPAADKYVVLTKKSYEKIVDYCTTIRYGEIEEGGKVYFHKSAIFPRKQFYNMYKDNPICRDPGEAKYIVVGKDMLSRVCHRLWSYNAWDNGREYLENADRGNGKEIPCIHLSYVEKDYPFPIEELGGFIDKLKSDVVFVLDSELGKKLPRENKLTDELIKTMQKMLLSSDRDSVKIGVEMLCSIDYTICAVEIALLMNACLNNIKAWNYIYTVEMKTLMNSLDSDFPSWRYSGDIRFVLEMLAKDPTKTYIGTVVNNWLQGYHKLPEGMLYKLTIDKE